jgi:16S rRNA (cytosine967-C5)-methyltransferase
VLKEAWTVAIETLSWMEMQKLSERLALARTLEELHVEDPNAIRYGYGLAVETTRRRNLIDKFINFVVSPKKIGEYNLGIQSFLRLYVYQSRIVKNWGRINLQEAIHIASLGRSILGWQMLRPVEQYLGFLLTQPLELAFKDLTVEQQVSLRTFHPSWFVKYCFNLMGREEGLAFLEGSMNPLPNYVRLNTVASNRDEIQQRLDSEGVKLEKVESLKDTYKVLEAKQPLNTLRSYREGAFYIQDKASCFAAQAAAPTQGAIVFDVCAAPGAKTSYLAQLMNNKGSIYSVDYSSRRLEAWQKEIARMRVTIAQSVMADATAPLPLDGEADLVVLDPPCTSTGVFAKQPSTKWRLGPKSINRMADIQWKMINSCAQKVKAGGFLTYSTCSITIEENEAIIERFLKEHPNFETTEISPELGLPGLHELTQCRRLYPHLHKCNGFFIAKLQKK